MSLQNMEEILTLEDSVFWEVGAVHSVFNSVYTEFGSQRVLPDVPSDLWVVWANEFSEG